MGIEKFSKEVCRTSYAQGNGQEVAIKVILKSKLHSEDEVERALHEMQLHPQLIHRNIIPCFASEETQDSIIIVTPLAKGDLHSFAVNKVVGEENCRRLCKQLLEGLAYLHRERLVHGDIKPGNILLFESAGGKYFAKICDFGFTERIDDSGFLPYRGMRGSLGYFSPEQLQKKSYGQPVDMFALGIIIYTLLCGYEPFYPTNRAGLLTGDSANDAEILAFESPYWDHISTAARDFLRSVLHGDPAKRLTASLALESDWIRIPSKSDNVLAQELAEDAHIQFE
jgi:calcium/calmodulin-dependent protein kinase I